MFSIDRFKTSLTISSNRGSRKSLLLFVSTDTRWLMAIIALLTFVSSIESLRVRWPLWRCRAHSTLSIRSLMATMALSTLLLPLPCRPVVATKHFHSCILWQSVTSSLISPLPCASVCFNSNFLVEPMATMALSSRRFASRWLP
jgi:hypothetical protein